MKSSLLCATLLLASPLFSAQSTPRIEVHFSPDGDCTETIVAELLKAKKSIYVQACSFTSTPIAAALVEAHKRGVDVEFILDKSQRAERHSAADVVSKGGISSFIDDKHVSAHNKVIVIDESTVITGSFDFSKSSEEKNAENLLVIRDAELAAKYLANWRAHLEHSVPYQSVRSMDQIPMPKRPGS